MSAQKMREGTTEVRVNGRGDELMGLLTSLNCSVAQKMLETGIKYDEVLNTLQAIAKDGLWMAANGKVVKRIETDL